MHFDRVVVTTKTLLVYFGNLVFHTLLCNQWLLNWQTHSNYASDLRSISAFSTFHEFIPGIPRNVFENYCKPGAIYPVSALPSFIRYVTYVNPLTYGVDGMRGALLGVSVFPVWVDAAVLGAIAIAMLALGAYSFSKAKAVA